MQQTALGSPHHFNHAGRTAAESLLPNQQCPEGAGVPRRGAQLRAGHPHLRWAVRTPCGQGRLMLRPLAGVQADVTLRVEEAPILSWPLWEARRTCKIHPLQTP
jgi:hypothetical protein